MNDDIGQRFQKVADEAGRQAAEIPCSIPDYRDGLQVIIDHLELLKECAEGDLKRMGRGEPSGEEDPE